MEGKAALCCCTARARQRHLHAQPLLWPCLWPRSLVLLRTHKGKAVKPYMGLLKMHLRCNLKENE